MTVQRFRRPVHVFVGLGFPHLVSTVQEVRQLLDEWTGSRCQKYAQALALCHSALACEEHVDVLCAAFEAFARAHGILAPDPIEVSVSRTAEDWMTA
ncbi:DUF982 domain-containing protein [Mesorhizobium sp. ES1-1]|uniref:DUF982 domain-containing protein n=1 Tax=Mesorhizobium sp. ES1-1 TaxID=2876629 RepID=UPI001CCC760A|nr:DUF982 domain-containing protein [Mesorhizobium sp. ES1-1]MBZ9677704.1 DUF982 domain-containing protein [Mesorhizobium sp. ES1-1]